MVDNNGKKNSKFSLSGDGLINRRIYLVVFFIAIGFGLLFFRLYYLQVRAADFYQEMADGQHKSKEEILPRRGEIFLKEKDGFFPVATSRDLATVFAVPKEVIKNDLGKTVPALAEILQLEHEEILQKLSKENDGYELLKRKLSDEEKNKIIEARIEGIHLINESWRFYPAKTLAAAVTGFVGYSKDKLEGMYGIEKFFEKRLRGSSGVLEQERDAGGRWISIGQRSLVPAKDGDGIALTLDRIIQFKTELILHNAVEHHKADGGKIIIMDPHEGKILAMAQEPTYDLNEYSKVEDGKVFHNSLISDSYECGSVFKAITMAIGLDSGKVDLDTTYTDTGQISEAGFTIENSDFKAYGKQTMTEIIEKSLNTGAIFVQQQVGNDRYLKYIKDFGFGKKTEIDLPNEVEGNISNLKTGRDIEFFTASFGQGITVTPLQLTNAYATFANGGRLLTPQIVDKIYSNEKEIKITKKKERKIISKETANELSLMLESNVKNGHGKLAGVPGYRVAGKTGTAQIADKEKGGYIEGATVGSFAGFAPVENPKFVMLVVIDYPKDVEWAESSAAPVFGELTKFLLDYYGTEPTEEYSEEDLMKFSATHNYANRQKEEEKDEDKEGGDEKDEED
jgi:cell division protein FtsI/penicillin-binding protein 2